MNMQQMLIQAQKMKRELEKALNELKAQEFSITKNGAVTIKMLGDKQSLPLKLMKMHLIKKTKTWLKNLLF